MGEDNVDLILDAIHTLREDLSSRMDKQDMRMDKQDESRGEQWKIINVIATRVCPAEQHANIDGRVKSLELDRAKMLGVVVAVPLVISVAAWIIEQWAKKGG